MEEKKTLEQFILDLENNEAEYRNFLKMDLDQRALFFQENGYDPVKKYYMRPTKILGFPKGQSLDNAAFWISPDGDFFDIDKQADDRHIYYLVDNPEFFGFTKKKIIDAYEKHGEPNPYDYSGGKKPQEKKAREELIIKALEYGWIRIRNYTKWFRWTLNVHQLDNKTKRVLQQWAVTVIENAPRYKTADAVLDTHTEKIKATIGSIAIGDFKAQIQEDYAQPVAFDLKGWGDKKKFTKYRDEKKYRAYKEDKEKDKEIIKQLEIDKAAEYERFKNRVIVEITLSRAWKQNTEHDCGAISGFRTFDKYGVRLTSKQRRERNDKLRSLILANTGLDYGVTRVRGKYPNNLTDEQKEQLKTEGEEPEQGFEDSFFVVDLKDRGDLEKFLQQWSEKFEQETVLFMPKGSIDNKTEAYLIGTAADDSELEIKYKQKSFFHVAHISKENPYYTIYVNGLPYVFEGAVREVKHPNTGFGYWAMYRNAFKPLYPEEG